MSNDQIDFEKAWLDFRSTIEKINDNNKNNPDYLKTFLTFMLINIISDLIIIAKNNNINLYYGEFLQKISNIANVDGDKCTTLIEGNFITELTSFSQKINDIIQHNIVLGKHTEKSEKDFIAHLNTLSKQGT